MAAGDAHWWCEDEAGRLSGSYLARFAPEGAETRYRSGSFAAGAPDGAWREWIELGEEEFELFSGRFKAGERDGAWTWFCGPGCMLTTVVEAHFEGGTPSGAWVFTGDQISSRFSWSNGKLSGEYRHNWMAQDESSSKAVNWAVAGAYRRGARSGSWVTTIDGEVVSEDSYSNAAGIQSGAGGRAKARRGKGGRGKRR